MDFKVLIDGSEDINTSVVNFNDNEFTVIHRISAERAAGFVQKVVTVAFSGENDEYSPEYVDIAKEVYLLACYTNINLDGAEPSYIYNMSMATGLHDIVMGNIDVCQYSSISASIDKRIKYLLDTNAMSIRKSIENIKSSFDEMLNKVKSVSDGIDAESMKNAVDALGKLKEIGASDIVSALSGRYGKDVVE